MPTCLIAIGGNSLIKPEQEGTTAQQRENARATCVQIAEVIALGWDVLVTHGNGPQIGSLLRRVELTADHAEYLPLDILDADTQGCMGYMLQQVLTNKLRLIGLSHTVVSLVTRVLVDPNDEAFDNPSKPIGPFYSKEVAEQRMQKFDVQLREDAGRGWRRVVASPKPQRIVELEAIKRMFGNGIVPIAIGGGGIPVVDRDGRYEGIAAVIDKDRASAMLAHELDVDVFLISTGVTHVQVAFGTDAAHNLGVVDAPTLKKHLDADEFAWGSMRPKVQALLNYLGGTQKKKRRAVVTTPEMIEPALRGNTGTQVLQVPPPV